MIFLALVVLGGPALFFAARAGQAELAAAQNGTLDFYTVTTGDVEVAISAIGRVQADQTANLTFTSAGRVAEVFVQEGAAVTSGQPIARLENTAQQNALDQANLALELARVRKEDLLAGPDAGQIAVAEAQIDAAIGAYQSLQQRAAPEDLEAARLRVQQAEAALAAAQEARATAPGGQSSEAYALLDARIGEAAFNLDIARLQLEQLQTGNSAQLGAAWARVEQAEAELERLLAGATPAQIDQADAAIAQAEAGVRRAQEALNDTLLTAPFDGVISALSLEVGAIATPALPVGTLQDADPLRIEVDVDEIDVREISEGMNATITFDALDDVSVNAVIERIAVVGVNRNGIINYPVTLRLEGADERVRVGMTAEASVVVEAQRGVLLVPNEYIRLDRQDRVAFVNIVNAEGTLEEIAITLGLQGDDASEVTDGLRAGDVLAVDLGGDAIPAFGG
ncbi:MAG: efflux RND transporter periplasmic adaptor subunit [Chloroflexota bacterium]|nr:efflux RND transporter periplasmic adaptor subunit [Chloroflexota bacterium]